jgi:CBS domain-containing protein
MNTIKQILAEKSKSIATIGPQDTVKSALDLMVTRDIGALLVVDGKKLIGIFTERDCVRKVTALGLNPQDIRVQTVMTARVRFVTLDMEVSQAMALMTERFFRHLPVLDEAQNILGIVSIGDLVKAKISEQDFIIEQLERYIAT